MAVTKTRSRDINETRTLWSLFLGMLVWFLHLNIINALTSTACKWSWLDTRILGLSALQWVQILVTVVAMALIGWFVFLSWRNWRSFQKKAPIDNPQLLTDTEKDRRPLLAFVGMTVNGFFFLYVIANFIPIFVLKGCGYF